ncbi:MAG: histidinol dehydrogenase [Rhizomicrobium sp.]
MPRRLDSKDGDFAPAFEALVSAKRGAEEDVVLKVRAIIARVRAEGDAALVALSNRYDCSGLSAAGLKVAPAEIEGAIAQVPKAELAAIDRAAARIEAYHRRQLPRDESFRDEQGAFLGWRWTPLDSAGLYVPGGTAAYPSSVLMNAIPASVAGVRRLAMTTPATAGRINPLVLAAARRAGVDEIFRIGGAQAIAALAYGTLSVPPVDKIVGPGNQWVAAAKREVFGQVGIDAIAGPSEILVIADGANDPDWIAADLLSQAEHDTSSESILITDDADFAGRVAEAVERALAVLPRKEIAAKSWNDHGAIIVVEKLDEAASLADRIAPEHLEIATAEPRRLLALVRHAGAIFLGRHTPEAMGDYIAGPNHVLPTSRTARFSSGLSVADFMKRTTIVELDAAALALLAPDAMTLAEAEGLDGHARSIGIRLNRRA